MGARCGVSAYGRCLIGMLPLFGGTLWGSSMRYGRCLTGMLPLVGDISMYFEAMQCWQMVTVEIVDFQSQTAPTARF